MCRFSRVGTRETKAYDVVRSPSLRHSQSRGNNGRSRRRAATPQPTPKHTTTPHREFVPPAARDAWHMGGIDLAAAVQMPRWLANMKYSDAAASDAAASDAAADNADEGGAGADAARRAVVGTLDLSSCVLE